MFYTKLSPYTTRSWDPNGNGSGKGMGPEKGLKVVTNAVDGIVAGQELWFPNAGMRIKNGTTDTSANAPGQCGDYWIYSNGSILQFFSGASTGRSVVSNSKLYAQSIRCVR